jgi:hypothetical protein
MLKRIHNAIIRRAFARNPAGGGTFSPRALNAIIAANLRQDALRAQFGHDEFHFDNNAFARSREYIEQQRALIQPALEGRQVMAAWEAFGRLTHTAQDFYSHSNYVDLWLVCQPNGMRPAPSEIDPLDDTLIENPSLRSGKFYYPLEAFSFVPGLKKLVIPLLPRDSHAWMNLDSEERGQLFEYAFQAAVKRTRTEYELTARAISDDLLRAFQDIPGSPLH